MFCYHFNYVIIFLVSSSCDVDLVWLIFEIDAYDISLHLFYPMLTIMVELAVGNRIHCKIHQLEVVLFVLSAMN